MSDPNNFRGVSLIDISNKILNGMMFNRIYKWAEDNSKLSESQAGFRKGYSTTDSILTLMSLGQKYLSTVNIVLVRTAKNNYFSLCTN